MIEITVAGTKSLKTIQQLATTTWHHAYSAILSPEQLKYMLGLFYSTSSLRHQLLELKHQFIIIKNEGQPAGFASYAALPGDETIFQLHKIYVLPGLQGKHLGENLLQHIIEEAKAAKAISLQLNVNRNNKAVGFYKKMGFTILREEDNDIGHGYYMNDYVLSLLL